MGGRGEAVRQLVAEPPDTREGAEKEADTLMHSFMETHNGFVKAWLDSYKKFGMTTWVAYTMLWKENRIRCILPSWTCLLDHFGVERFL